ncbi:hypothetical protein GON03_02880 [Nocardioides sp. MAH-18]|uniref:Uncharacterized protein n=1 Tax=Nocardioides agri TaxID=2682843 RepID=A0A6L6XLZ8_9ACTN|nr:MULTISPECIES: hypothetical protein [unclassified Nocardioides]MBA2953241.1 hypothetical protein [Nocardioides sp. CGMCC 1.13656]MVQ48110.1 hypothetical protein [Nocardioides sp. MAH-18]
MTTTAARSAAPTARGPWTPGRLVGTVAASALLLIGALLVVAGVAVGVGSGVLRDDDGLYRTSATTWRSPGYAVRSEDVYLHRAPMMPGSPGRMMGRVEVSAVSTDGRAVFVGVARAADVHRYLQGVAGSTVADPWGAASASTRDTVGGPPGLLPTEASFWVTSASGPGTRVLSWTPGSGRWCVVVMNADGSAPVSADVTVAAELPFVDGAATTLLVSGVALVAVAAIGLLLAIPPTRRPPGDQE